jgi:hypothetical protein
MSRDQSRLGLYIVTDGKNVETDTFTEFVHKVEAAAAKPKKARGTGNQANLLNGTDGEYFWPIREDRRCAFTHTKGDRAGKRCGAWSMRNGTRCARHGGYREQPDHPATIRRLALIQHQQAKSIANKELRRAPPKTRHTVEQALELEGLPLSPSTVLQGVQAYIIDDNGKAWRRFIAAAIAGKPKKQGE